MNTGERKGRAIKTELEIETSGVSISFIGNGGIDAVDPK